MREDRDRIVAMLHEAEIPVTPTTTGLFNAEHAYGDADQAIAYVERLRDVGADEVMFLIQMGTVPAGRVPRDDPPARRTGAAEVPLGVPSSSCRSHPPPRRCSTSSRRSTCRRCGSRTSTQSAERDTNVIGALDEPVEVKSVENRTIPCSVGDMPVRIYTPESKQPRPLIVYYHGGGFVFCSLDTHDGTCRRLANATGAVVVSVDYRLAPECQFPGPADDCYEAAIWAHRHADELDADAEVFVVAGDSAGGNLAAVTALKARSAAGRRSRSRSSSIPSSTLPARRRRSRPTARATSSTPSRCAGCGRSTSGPEGDGTHPHASPIRADDHADLPPAIVITAEYDPLRDEGEAYADKLRAAGVPVTMVRYDGMIHGFVSMPMLFPEGNQAMDEIAAALHRAGNEAVTRSA